MTPLVETFRRLRRMPGAELRARTAMALHQRADSLGWALRRPKWRRRDLVSALDPRVTGMTMVVRRLEDGDWAGAQRLLTAHLLEREPRFVLAPGSRSALADAIRRHFPAAATDAAGRADRALTGHLDVLGYRNVWFGLRPGAADIDWHRDPIHRRTPPPRHWSRVPFLDPASGDHKIIWELNRHQHWLVFGRAFWLTGDPRFRDGFLGQLDSWLAANPPRTGVNWASMLELAFRSISWIWALHLFVGTEEERSAWIVDLLLGLDRQLTLVERNLSTYFSPNTHLLGEGLGLYVAGRVLPELRRSQCWEETGRNVLLAGIERQILDDGGHVELSPHYHRYTLDFYLLALGVARATRDVQAIGRFADGVARLARFGLDLADRDLRLPRIGDNDGGILFPMCGAETADVGESLALAGALLGRTDLADGRPREAVAWLTGAVPEPAVRQDRRTSVALPSSGYVVSRSAQGDHLVMDVGALGYLNAGHAHADALSVTLNVSGHPLLIDPGTACYTVDPAARDRFRSTVFHNTLTLDDRSQSIPSGPFRWSSAAAAALHVWRSNPAFDYAEASHDGYRPVVHHRQVLSRPGCWIVVDWVQGPGTHRAAVHWHLDPQWSVATEGPGLIQVRRPSGPCVWFMALGAPLAIIRGADGGSDLGWYAPEYGHVLPTTTIRARTDEAAPFPIVTVIVDSTEAPSLSAIDVRNSQGAPRGIALQLQTSSWAEVATVDEPLVPNTAVAGSRRRTGHVDTDARVLVVREGRRPTTTEVWMVDGTTAESDGHALVDSPAVIVPDLYAAASGGRVRVETSQPALVPAVTRTLGSLDERARAAASGE